MSKHDFTEDEFTRRRERTREAVASAGLDWLIVIHPVSIRWLTGSDAKSYQEFQCLLISARPGPIVVLTREGERNEYRDDAWVDELHTFGGREPEDPLVSFEALSRSLGLVGSRVGLEIPAFYLHPHHATRLQQLFTSPPLVEATGLIPDLMLVKSPRELDYIREAARRADLAMARFADDLQAGRTELQLAGSVLQTLSNLGSGLAASPINLVTGERSCFSHGAPTERVLRAGDTGNLEFGATCRRYTATIGRQFCLGRPATRVLELFDIVSTACDALRELVRPGVPASVPHEAAKRVIAAAGLDRGRVHLSGYGLAPGFPPSWAEPLYLFGGTTRTLEPGMVLTVEPPVFLGDERLGVRLIDNLLVTENGCELLTRFPRDLICVAD